MEIIDNTKDPACPYRYTPIPVFRTTYEQQAYLAEEKRRWLEGYNGLTGKHYFYLSQCKIKHGTSGAFIRPYFRDVDMWMFEAIDKAISMNYDLGIIKRREIGLTSVGAGCLPNYYMRVYPGSTSIMTSCDKPRIFRAFEDKTAIVYDNLHDDIKPIEVRRNQTKESVYLKTRMKVRLDSGEIEVRESDIFCSETVKNPSAFSSIRCKYGFYDEFPLHTNRENLLSSSRSCFMEGTKRTGFLLWGGTVEEGIKNETLTELKKIIADSKNSETLIFFVEAWMGLQEFMSPNGWSNKEKGVEWVEKKREQLLKLDSKVEYLAFKKNYPLTIDEAVEIGNDGTLPPEVVAKLNEQQKRIMNEPPPITNYDIEGGIAKPNPIKGKFVILAHPQKGFTYIAGTDPIPFGDNNLSDGSDYAIAIKCRETDTYVAYYMERNMNSDLVVSNSIALQDYYFGAKTMLEMNMGGVTLKTYEDLGRKDLLADKPSSLGIKFANAKNTKGYFKNDKMAQMGNNLLIKYLIHHSDNIWFMKLIEELGKYLVGNTDLLDAVIGCEIYDANMVSKNKKSAAPRTEKEIPVVIRDPITGRTEIKWKKVQISK